MKKTLFLFAIVAISVGSASAQKARSTTSSSAAAQAAATGGGIASGTQVSGQLQSTLDVDKARVGDQVLVKTTKAVKQNGQTVVSKGSTLVGRVTEVAERSKQNSTSRLGVVFDRLRQNGREIPISGMITSVLNVSSSTGYASAEEEIEYGSAQSTRRSRQSKTNGGLLGGVTSTAGGVVNSTVQTVGGVANTTGRVVGGTANTAAGAVRGLSISSATGASAQGGSVLSLSGGNLRLEKGTSVNLAISSSTAVEN